MSYTTTKEKNMTSTNLTTPFDFSGSLYWLASDAGRTASTWVNLLPGRLFFTTEANDRTAKTLCVRVTCPGRFDEGFLAVVRYDSRDHMHADVVEIQDGVRAAKAASDVRLAASNARLDAEYAAKRAAVRGAL